MAVTVALGGRTHAGNSNSKKTPEDEKFPGLCLFYNI